MSGSFDSSIAAKTKYQNTIICSSTQTCRVQSFIEHIPCSSKALHTYPVKKNRERDLYPGHMKVILKVFCLYHAILRVKRTRILTNALAVIQDSPKYIYGQPYLLIIIKMTSLLKHSVVSSVASRSHCILSPEISSSLHQLVTCQLSFRTKICPLKAPDSLIFFYVVNSEKKLSSAEHSEQNCV